MHFLDPYNITIDWSTSVVRKKSIIFEDFKVIENDVAYMFSKLVVTINRYNMIKHHYDVTISFGDDYGFSINFCNYPDNERVIISSIRFNDIRKILGKSLLDNWESNEPVTVKLDSVISWTPAKLQSVGNLILDRNTLYTALEHRKHFGSHVTVTQKVKDFILDTEDDEFYSHNGMLVPRIKRAIDVNIKTKRPCMGASSLTCQLMKNSLLTPEKTFRRKIIEAILALIAENKYGLSKDDIMQLYVDMVETGPDTYGLDDGARLYFGKSFEDLNELEVAVMSYLLCNPVNFYDAVKNDSKLLRMKLPAYLSQIKGLTPNYIDFAPPLGRYMLK